MDAVDSCFVGLFLYFEVFSVENGSINDFVEFYVGVVRFCHGGGKVHGIYKCFYCYHLKVLKIERYLKKCCFFYYITSISDFRRY